MTRFVVIGCAVVTAGIVAALFAFGMPGWHGDLRWLLPMRAFHASAESMSPTLKVGDHLVAWRRWNGEFARGEIVVFRAGDGQAWIKRIAGVAGDTIQMADGVVVLNGKPVSRQPAGAGPATPDGMPTHLFAERFSGEAAAHRVLDSGVTMGDNTAVFRVPPGRVFLLGDNRDNSADSRFDHMGGFVGDNMVAVGDIYGSVTPPAR